MLFEVNTLGGHGTVCYMGSTDRGRGTYFLILRPPISGTAETEDLKLCAHIESDGP